MSTAFMTIIKKTENTLVGFKVLILGHPITILWNFSNHLGNMPQSFLFLMIALEQHRWSTNREGILDRHIKWWFHKMTTDVQVCWSCSVLSIMNCRESCEGFYLTKIILTPPIAYPTFFRTDTSDAMSKC